MTILPLILAVAVVIGLLIILFLAMRFQGGLFGAAGMIGGISRLGCGSLFFGIIVILVIAAAIGFIAGRFPV